MAHIPAGFYYLEESDSPTPLITVTPLSLKYNENTGDNTYGPEHDPWFLNMILYECRYDYEKFAKIVWLEASNIEQVVCGVAKWLQEREYEPAEPFTYDYCITDRAITVPAHLFNNPCRKRPDSDSALDDFIKDNHLFDTFGGDNYLYQIEDDHNVPGTSISDQIYQLTGVGHWGPICQRTLPNTQSIGNEVSRST